MKKVVVVGGGIAGLSCAYELRKGGAEVTVVEKDKLGGVIRTERHGDLLIEGGPDSFITQKPWAKELCDELGLADQLIPSKSGKVYVWYRDRLHEMPAGLYLTVPTKVWPFLTSGLISFFGKLRMGMDLVLPRGPEVEDESIGSFIRRRLGAEALEKLAEPIMAGIYVASADELSLRSTFPRFAEMEREHRSLIKAMRKTPRTGNVSPFLSLRDGMKTLVDRLLERMKGVTFLEGKEVTAIAPGSVTLADGELKADEIVLAIPTPAARRLWPSIPPIKYMTTTTVSLAYDTFRDLEGTGFVIPRSQNRRILACTWTSNKFEARAPAGRLLVRCFIKGDVDDPVRVASEEMTAMLGAPAPLFSRAFHWPERNPVYEVGHARRMREFEATLPAGLHLCGSGFHGTGIPDCVKDGRAVARRILESK
jgi:protoporphyrinogen/coproporphyrinogen III oxidase